MVRFAMGCAFGFVAAVVLCGSREARAWRQSEPESELYVARDPEDRTWVDNESLREKMMDKTLADSYPASDPPSSIPDPGADDSMCAA